MDEGSGYCGSSGGIESVSDASKIANMVYDRRWRGMKSVWTEIFGRQARYYGYGGKEGEREVDYFTGLLRETDKKEFSFRGIESEIVRRHPR